VTTASKYASKLRGHHFVGIVGFLVIALLLSFRQLYFWVRNLLIGNLFEKMRNDI